MLFGRFRLALVASLVLLASLVAVGRPAASARLAIRHTMPLRSSASAAPRAFAAAAATPVNAHLNYYRGNVLTHVQIDLVVWNRWGYGSDVPLTGPRSVSTFLSGMVNSPYVDWLKEYNTANPLQQIGRGNLEGIYTIHVDPDRNGAVIYNSQIQKELTAQINHGHLPAPGPNRLYVVYFPPGHTIKLDGDSSRKNFCAYHNSMSYGSGQAYFVVLPYEVNIAGCHISATSANFDNLTEVTSHEVIEAVTDPAVGLQNNIGWYDPNNGEIGDICNFQPATLQFPDGATYTVQREWSNTYGACIVVPPPPVTPPTCSSPAANSDHLSPGQCLKPNQYLRSGFHGYELLLRGDGQLGLIGGAGYPWVSGTIGRNVTEAMMQSDGNFVIWGPNGPVWQTNTAGHQNSTLLVQDNGNVVIFGPNGPTWASNTANTSCGMPFATDTMLTGQCLGRTASLHSLNGHYRFVHQSDGNVVLYGSAGPLWSTGTGNQSSQWAGLRFDGNFVVQGIGGSPVWSANTGGRGATKLVVQNDGNVVVFAGSTPIWATNTAGRQ